MEYSTTFQPSGHQIAKKMVTRYGMSENVGVICYDDDDDEVFIGRDLAHAKAHSELVSGEIDREIPAAASYSLLRLRRSE